MHDVAPIVARAVEVVGSQGKLARAVGCSQQFIWKLVHRERTGISLETALRFERATEGKVKAAELRPDAAKLLAPTPQPEPVS